MLGGGGVTTYNSTMWFQYKLIYNILAIWRYLFNLITDYITDSSTCGICGSSVKIIQHLFTRCSTVQTLWSSPREWIEENVNQNYELGKIYIWIPSPGPEVLANEVYITFNKKIYILVCKNEILAKIGLSKNITKPKILQTKVYISSKLKKN